MKRFIALCIIMIAMGLCCQSCRNVSHHFNTTAVGSYFHIGVADWGVTFGSGALLMQAVRENTATVIETRDKADSDSSPSVSLKDVRRIEFHSYPMVSGYLKDIAKKDPETAKKYMETMPSLVPFNAKGEDKKPEKEEK